MPLPPRCACGGHVANQLKEQLGIPEDYFTAIPPALTEADRRRLEAFRQGLMSRGAALPGGLIIIHTY